MGRSFFAAADLRRYAPPILFRLGEKECAVHGGRKSRLVQTCPSGQVWGCERLIASFPQACPVPSRCAVTRLATHAYAASCDAFSNSEGAFQSALLLFPLPLRGGSFQRGGRSPLFVSFEGVVQEGETEIPLLACLLDRARPVFSTGRKWGVHCPPPPRCHSPLPAGKLVQRNIVKIRQGNERRKLRFPQAPFIVLIPTQAQSRPGCNLRLRQPSLFSQLKKVFMELHTASFY